MGEIAYPRDGPDISMNDINKKKDDNSHSRKGRRGKGSQNNNN